ncbi:MAG: hypothetical protein LBS92_02770 [Candidatus Methanoplasma sp.]|jgi:hypothetical protein|nr:hypothetical protein [Candidatus Methanoplasma sp.]
MARKNSETAKKDEDDGPKASARHAKIARSKKNEVEDLKKKISTDHYLAKKYEAERKAAIGELPKEERKAAKEELRESIVKRKEAERRDKDALDDLIYIDKAEKRAASKAAVDDDEWVKGGRKKSKKDKN